MSTQAGDDAEVETVAEELTPEQMKERLSILERRVKRITMERNKARAAYARLARIAEPFAGHTAPSFRKWLNGENPENVRLWSRALAVARQPDADHMVVYRILRQAETMALAVINEEQEKYEARRFLNAVGRLFQAGS